VVYLLQVPPIAVPPGLEAVKAAQGVQMLATRPLQATDDGMQVLGDADAAEMLALATLTEPGPFLARTHTMGRFIGVRIGGRLAAMAGERMRFPGYVEVSGVCTHPDFRGRGLARRLSAAVAADIQRRGEQPFLHAWATNTAAIALYESLGFKVRTEVNVAVLRRRAD
jgi:predicted GNAT family acetyltransferase